MSLKQQSAKIFWLAVLTVCILIVVRAVFDKNGLPQYRKLKGELSEAQKRTDQLRDENETLKNQLHLLQTDEHYLERVARDEMGLVRPDEVIFQVRKPDGSTPPKPIVMDTPAPPLKEEPALAKPKAKKTDGAQGKTTSPPASVAATQENSGSLNVAAEPGAPSKPADNSAKTAPEPDTTTDPADSSEDEDEP